MMWSQASLSKWSLRLKFHQHFQMLRYLLLLLKMHRNHTWCHALQSHHNRRCHHRPLIYCRLFLPVKCPLKLLLRHLHHQKTTVSQSTRAAFHLIHRRNKCPAHRRQKFARWVALLPQTPIYLAQLWPAWTHHVTDLIFNKWQWIECISLILMWNRSYASEFDLFMTYQSHMYLIHSVHNNVTEKNVQILEIM